MVDLVACIAAAVEVPVTADIEGGYGQDAADVADTVTRVLEADAVGVKHRGRHPAPGRTRGTADGDPGRGRAGGSLFLNARTGTYLFGLGDPATRLEDTLERGRAYVDAGADGIFVPNVTAPATIAESAPCPFPLDGMFTRLAPGDDR